MRVPSCSDANASRARNASLAAMPENSTHAAPARLLRRLAIVLGAARRDRRRRHRHDVHLVAVALARGEIGLLDLGGEPQVGAQGEDREQQQEEDEAGHAGSAGARDERRGRRGRDCRGWHGGSGKVRASSPAAPPESMILLGGAGRRVAIASRMRSMAPAHACIAPLVIASGVLAGNSANAPSVRRRPAVPRSSERRMSVGPGDDEPAEELALGRERIDGERGARVHHQLVAARGAMGGDERGPAVGTELRGIAIAVGDAELRGRGRITREHAARGQRRCAGSRRDALALGHVGQRSRASTAGPRVQTPSSEAASAVAIAPRDRPRAAVVHAPLDAGVARVDREDRRSSLIGSSGPRAARSPPKRGARRAAVGSVTTSAPSASDVGHLGFVRRLRCAGQHAHPAALVGVQRAPRVARARRSRCASNCASAVESSASSAASSALREGTGERSRATSVTGWSMRSRRARPAGSSRPRRSPRRSVPASRRWSPRGCPRACGNRPRRRWATSPARARRRTYASARATATPTASDRPARCPAPRSKRHSSEKVSEPPSARNPRAAAPAAPGALPFGGEARARGRAGGRKRQQPRGGGIDFVHDLQAHARLARELARDRGAIEELDRLGEPIALARARRRSRPPAPARASALRRAWPASVRGPGHVLARMEAPVGEAPQRLEGEGAHSLRAVLAQHREGFAPVGDVGDDRVEQQLHAARELRALAVVGFAR